jgi:hypothetical protein
MDTGSDTGKFCRILDIPNIDVMPTTLYAQADTMLRQKEAYQEVNHADI